MTEQTKKDGINRRDFLKIGGVATGSLFGATLIDLATDGNILATNDAGGFHIRHHSKDNPPYEVADSYQRPDGLNTSFQRNPDWIQPYSENAAKNHEEGHAGDDWLAYAYAAGASTYFFDTNNMYDWDQSLAAGSYVPEGRWKPEEHGYTIEDTTKIMKRSAKLLGASLAGIAAVDERWFYSRTIDMEPITTGQGPPPEAMQAMIPQMLASMEPEAFKEMLLGAMENMDPALLPPGVTPEMMANMSGEQLQAMAPQMMGNADPAMMAALMENMDPSMMPEMGPGSGMDMRAMIEAMTYDVVFSDDIEAPIIEPGRRIIPRSMNRIIVMAFEMDEGSISTGGNTHVTSILGDAAAFDGYSRMAFTTSRLANMIRNLGYNALAMGNDHAITPPMAVDAGLGEIGRNGILITPKYGPRVRLSKVITDMPLDVDGPITFGVTEFCEVCGKCADTCPSAAIPVGDRTFESPESGNPGYYHWPIEGDKCLSTWSNVGGSCYNCIRTCPFNKPEGWLHDATRILIGVKSGPLNSLMLKLDDISGYGGEKGNDPKDFWDIDTYVHIKD